LEITMIRRLTALTFASVLLVACSTTKPAAQPVAVDPVTDPSIVGAVDEAVLQGSIEGAAAARTGRRIGRVAGVFAAVFGGPSHESLDDAIDRYRLTRDAATAAGAVIGASKGATAGAKRGFVLDLQFAELHEIEGVSVLRPFPDEIEASFTISPTQELLVRIAGVFAGREERAIDIQAPDDAALDVRESLIALGVPASSLSAHRNDELREVVLRIRYRS
jgi:hypothetical protein